METARAMLMDKGLPKWFWAEAVSTVVSLLNMISNQSCARQGANQSLEWTENLSKTSQGLRLHILYTRFERKKRKTYEKTKEGICLGYSTQSKCYRVYGLVTKKLIIS